MNKCYYRIIWKNYPDDGTPINEQNLNKIDVAADEMDNRIISLDSTKFDKSEAQLLVKYIEYDEDTGIFKITHYNGTSYTIDTLLEKLAINFDYDYQNQRLIITLSDGEVKYVDLSALITQYEFLNSDTVHFTISADGKVKAEVKEGSIQEKHLRPDYLADIRVESAKAAASAVEAGKSEASAAASQAESKKSEDAAKESEKSAAASAGESADSAAASLDEAAKQQRAQRQQKTVRMQQRYQKRMLRPARMLRRQARLRQPEVQGMRSSLRRMQLDSQRKRNPLPMAGPEPERGRTLIMQKSTMSRRKQHQNAFQERFTTWEQWHLPIFLTFLLQKQVICTTFPMNLLQIALLKMGLALQYLLGLTCIKPLMVIGMCCLEFVRFVIMPTFLKATQQKMKILRGLYGISRQRLLSADPLPMPMLYFW